ncbi:vWA domain-containing protein [Mycolicibacterium vaccae]|uniref:vWA domain-containing protein n=1 Tax=Mycolicibacterium vaccae TaxID=1810 RepID=UPI003D011891
MNLSVAPVFPVWLIIVLAVVAVALRIAAFLAARRRHTRPQVGRSLLRLGVGVLAILCLGTAALRIGDESRTQRPPRLTAEAEETNVNVFLLIDRSLGMTTPDFGAGEERMAAALRDVGTVLGTYPDARYAVMSYSDTARSEWPLSPDTWSLRAFLANYGTYGATMMRAPKAALVSAPDDLLREQLTGASTAYPGSANLVFIFGSGSDPGDWAYDIPQGQVSGGAVFGYGTKTGARVLWRSEGGDLEFLTIGLNEPALRTAADSLDIEYLPRPDGPLPPDVLPTAVPQAAPVEPVVPAVPHPNRIEYYWFFAALAALLFGFELYGLGSHWLRRRHGGVRR